MERNRFQDLIASGWKRKSKCYIHELKICLASDGFDKRNKLYWRYYPRLSNNFLIHLTEIIEFLEAAGELA